MIGKTGEWGVQAGGDWLQETTVVVKVVLVVCILTVVKVGRDRTERPRR